MAFAHRITASAPWVGAPGPGPAFDMVLYPREVLLVLLILFLQEGYVIRASGDGNALFDDTGSHVFTNSTYNQDFGAPNFQQSATNNPAIAGSMCNYGCWFLVETPPGTVAGSECWWAFQIGSQVDPDGGTGAQLVMNVWRYEQLPDLTTANATTVPQGDLNVADDAPNETLMIGAVEPGGGGNIYAEPVTSYVYRFGSFGAPSYWNFAVDGDPAAPRWWVEWHPQGGTLAQANAGAGVILSDLVTNPPAGDERRTVGALFVDDSYGALAGQVRRAYLPAGSRYDVPGSGGTGPSVCSYGARAATYCVGLYDSCGAGDLVPAYNVAGTGLGGNSLLSGQEEPLPVTWATHDTCDLSRAGTVKGQSMTLLWNTDDSVPQLQCESIGARTFVKMGQFWVEYNDGPSPGMNGSTFSL